MKILATLILALAAGSTCSALAQTLPGPISKEIKVPMLQGKAAQNFGRADRNLDGQVTRHELISYGDKSMVFAVLDQDADGKLSSSEWGRHSGNDEYPGNNE